jgi:hypothetical protein
MTWKKSTDIATRQFNRHGLGKAVAAGLVCQEAERLYPSLFRALSIKNQVLHLEVSKANQLDLKLIEGKLLQELAAFAKAKNIPIPQRIRLTFSE